MKQFDFGMGGADNAKAKGKRQSLRGLVSRNAMASTGGTDIISVSPGAVR